MILILKAGKPRGAGLSRIGIFGDRWPAANVEPLPIAVVCWTICLMCTTCCRSVSITTSPSTEAG